MVDGAAGHIENEKERLVKTPWFEHEIPFTLSTPSFGINFGSVVIIVLPCADCGSSSIANSLLCLQWIAIS